MIVQNEAKSLKVLIMTYRLADYEAPVISPHARAQQIIHVLLKDLLEAPRRLRAALPTIRKMTQRKAPEPGARWATPKT